MSKYEVAMLESEPEKVEPAVCTLVEPAFCTLVPGPGSDSRVRVRVAGPSHQREDGALGALGAHGGHKHEPGHGHHEVDLGGEW
eukprot:scaffold7924_cov70-Phaeocystis_antarctica.AAC.2